MVASWRWRYIRDWVCAFVSIYILINCETKSLRLCRYCLAYDVIVLTGYWIITARCVRPRMQWDKIYKHGYNANLRALSEITRCTFVTAVMLNIGVFWDEILCLLVSGFRRFGALSYLCFYLAGLLVAGLLKMPIHKVSVKRLEPLAQQNRVISQRIWYPLFLL
jgi:hypothetical protein